MNNKKVDEIKEVDENEGSYLEVLKQHKPKNQHTMPSSKLGIQNEPKPG